MFNDETYIKNLIYNINLILKEKNNIEIFYENFYILDYFVNLIENKKNMISMKIYIFVEFIMSVLFNTKIDNLFSFKHNKRLIKQLLDWFFIYGYIIPDELIYYTHNKKFENIINVIQSIYEGAISENNFQNLDYNNIIITDNYDKLIIYIKNVFNITPIRFYWISSCIRYILYKIY